MGRFKKGLFLGSLLGAGMMWMNVTKKGKEVRGQLLNNAADVYVQVEKKLKESGALDKVTKQKYMRVVKEVVDKYALENGLAKSMKNMIVKLVATQWKRRKTK